MITKQDFTLTQAIKLPKHHGSNQTWLLHELLG